MAQRTEFLSGGLVTARDPSLLAEGEVQQAEDVLLKPGSPSIFKAPGRALFGVLSDAVDGLAYCHFDNVVDRVVAVSDGNYMATPAGNGSFTTIAAGASTVLNTVSMTNRSALLSGGTNKVLLSSGVARPMGLSPITTTPSVSVTTGGNWPLVGRFGYFEYWTTEVYLVGDEEVESTFVGTPKTVHITVSGNKAIIQKPGQVNSGATHWRVYRSEPKTLETDVAFPVGFQIATIPKATTSFEDGGGATSSYSLPAAYDASIPNVDVYVPWSNPERLLAADASNASSGTVVGGFSAPVVLYNFGLSLINPITKITARVNGMQTGGGNSEVSVEILLSWDAGVSWTNAAVVSVGTAQTDYDVTGLWGRTWTASELSNTNFRLKLNVVGLESGTLEADYVKVSVDNGGTTSDQSTLFPTITITAGPVTGSIGANGRPPDATTGDIFQGSLVMNDVANPREAAWTIPGTLDYSPTIYRMAFDWPVRNIKSVGSACLIGQSAQVERLNYLPLEDDPEFNTGRARDIVDSDDGISGPTAACKFTLGGRLYVFYVGFTSLRMTDGFQAQSATDDIIWPDIYGSANLFKAIAINNALYHEIQVYYGTKMLRLSYDPTHLKGTPSNPKLKVVGITNYAATAATFGISDSDARVVYTGRSDGFVYVENSGYSDASGEGINPLIVSREIHEGGMAMGWELDQLGIHHPDNDGAVAEVSYISSLANYPDRVTPTTPVVMDARALSMITQGDTGDGLAIKLTGTDDESPWTVDYMTLFPGQMGDTAPLKR